MTNVAAISNLKDRVLLHLVGRRILLVHCVVGATSIVVVQVVVHSMVVVVVEKGLLLCCKLVFSQSRRHGVA